MDDLEFLRWLRAIDLHRGLPVALATGAHFVDDTIPNALRELGAEIRYKPLWLEDLADLVRTMLKSHPLAGHSR